VARRVGRGIALLFHDRGTRRGWVVSSTARPYVTPGKDPVPIVQEAGWAPEPVWSGGKSLPTGIRTPDRPVLSRYTDWATRPADNFYTKAKQMTRDHSTNLKGQYRAAIFNLDIPLRFVASFSVKYTMLFLSPQ